MSNCNPSSDLFNVPPSFDHCAVPVCLSTGDVLGLAFTAGAGFVSALAVIGLLGYIAINYVTILRKEVNDSPNLIRKNIDGLMLNLLIADLVMSLGGIVNIHWISKSQVSCGQVCSAQGAIQLLGEPTVALFTLAVTISTFISVARGGTTGAQIRIWGSATLGVWAFGALWAGIGGTLDKFYVPTPYWCWISQKYKAQRIGAEYFWLWLSGFGSILLYTPLFLMLRGNIVWIPAIGRKSLDWNWKAPGKGWANEMALLCYPLTYTITVLPLSVVRWYTFNGHRVNSAASFAAVCLFNLSGALNVGLTLFVRPNVLLLDYQLGNPSPPPERAVSNGGHEEIGMVPVVNPREPEIMERNID
ncbi:unnamed protein product [Rhizoctonia solani]|uniref:Glucose receptor Git3 N-terminal domain-containing protein n=1 Tax=Rhizoctonia solani TaxID=456999 RepID=A0A8H3H0M9_9AGAM|nr:unnamed protein product [Rhizoctonia solani]